jgi:Arrestin (or S-antigen), C-terminal domain
MGFLGFGSKGDVQIDLDREDVLPGETVQVTVRATPGKDLELQEGRVELVYENEYTYREQASTDSVWATHSRTKTDRKVVEEQRFLAPGTVTADMPLEQTVELTIPPDAAPSAEGKITKVRWTVVATLARPRARDVHGEATIEVLSPADPSADASEEVDSHSDCELELRLDRTDFGPGDEIAGTLVLTPLRDCDVDEVRVELVRREEVPRKEGNEEVVREADATLDGAVELTPSLPREWPFRLVLPLDLVPCLRTKESRVTWRLKGVASRRMRSDYRVERHLDVHTAPSRRA